MANKKKKSEPEKAIVRQLLGRENVLLGYIIWCDGCKCGHAFHTEQTNQIGAIWKFNGNMEAPTFTPSMLVKSGHYVDGKHPCWCDYHKKPDAKPDAPTCGICHSFVTDGKMQFLGDCTHELAGKTVPLEPF